MAKTKAKTKDEMNDSPAPPQPETTTDATARQGQLPLFYERPRPLHLTEHADLALKVPPSFAFAANTVAVPLVLGEFMAATKDYPIVFGPGDIPVPVAFLGLTKGDNLFVDANGQWLPGAYVPAYLRRYPFLLVDSPENNRRILFVDEASSNVTRGHGTALIADGKPTEAAQNALKLCEAYAYDQQMTREFCEKLVANDLLETRNITITLADGGKIVLQDMRAISPRKFEEMSDGEYLEWRKKKWLFPAYCHFQSALNWQRLAERAAARKAGA